jgi:hypothetical protein
VTQWLKNAGNASAAVKALVDAEIERAKLAKSAN